MKTLHVVTPIICFAVGTLIGVSGSRFFLTDSHPAAEVSVQTNSTGQTTSPKPVSSVDVVPKNTTDVTHDSVLVGPDSLKDTIDTIAEDVENRGENRDLFVRTMRDWIDTDLAGVQSYLEPLIDNGNSSMRLGWLLLTSSELLSLNHADETLDWLLDLPGGYVRDQMLQSVQLAFARHSPEKAIEMAMSATGDGNEEKHYMVTSMLMDWAQSDPEAAISWLDGHELNEFHQDMLMPLFYSWLETDPEAALLKIDLLPESNQKSGLLASYAMFVARTDPERAYYWADSLVDTRAAHQAKGHILQQWGTTDPHALRQFIEGVSDEYERGLLMDSAAPLLGSAQDLTDPYERLAWSETLTPIQRMEVRRSVIYEWMQTSPEDAMQWIQTNASVEEAEEFQYMVASSLPYTDIELAKTMFESSNKEVREVMSYGLMEALYRDNPDAARSWIELYQGTEAGIGLYQGMVSLMAYDHPAEALEMALAYTGPERQNLLSGLVSVLGSVNPALISELAQSPNLTQEESEMLAPVMRQSQLYPVYVEGRY